MREIAKVKRGKGRTKRVWPLVGEVVKGREGREWSLWGWQVMEEVCKGKGA